MSWNVQRPPLHTALLPQHASGTGQTWPSTPHGASIPGNGVSHPGTVVVVVVVVTVVVVTVVVVTVVVNVLVVVVVVVPPVSVSTTTFPPQAASPKAAAPKKRRVRMSLLTTLSRTPGAWA